MWILEPVEPASIIRAYCKRVPDKEEWGWVQCVVDEGSRSVAYESGCVVGGFGAATTGGRCCWFVSGALWKGKTLYSCGILFP